jgi:methyltransferase (TIGR00027 family)
MANLQTTKTKSNLPPVPSTALVTLACRTIDAQSAHPVLGDHFAADTLAAIDYDPASSPVPSKLFSSFLLLVLLRARLLDVWTTEFLAAHPEATVLHLACGLDSRALRLGWGKGVRWVDVDLPDMVTLRRQVVATPETQGEYRLVAADLLNQGWLEDIPADRPVLVVMEGLLPYLQADEAKGLVRRIVERFDGMGGQVVFDMVGSWFIKMQGFNRPISSTGAVMHFGMDDGADIEALHPQIKTADALKPLDIPGAREVLPWILQLQLWLFSWFPGPRTMSQQFRFSF